MEVLVYLALGLSIWILVPSERAALLGRVAERSAQGEQRQSGSDDSEDADPDPDVAAAARDR